MKKIITLMFATVFVLFAVKATTWTVSNNPDIPGQFTQVATAIASPQTTEGDTLLVAGSPIKYTDFTLTERYVIIGAGFNNPYGNSTIISSIYLKQSGGFSSSGSVISGFYIDDYLYIQVVEANKTIENVTIDRCWLDYYVYLYGPNNHDTIRNITLKNCVIEDGTFYFDNIAYYDGILITNNLFDNQVFGQSSSETLEGVTVKNNAFINEATNIFGGIKNMVIEDNIFFKANPQGCSGCTFTNNTSYGSGTDVLPGTGNLGSGNEVRDPKYINYTSSDADFIWTHNLHLQASSPELTSGTGGGQRGIYGGPSPVEIGNNPAIPQVTEITFTDNASSVKEEGTLKVKFKAKKQD